MFSVDLLGSGDMCPVGLLLTCMEKEIGQQKEKNGTNNKIIMKIWYSQVPLRRRLHHIWKWKYACSLKLRRRIESPDAPPTRSSPKYTFIIFKYTNLFFAFSIRLLPLLRLLYSIVVLRRSMCHSFLFTFFSLRWRLLARAFTHQIKYTIYSVYDFSCAWVLDQFVFTSLRTSQGERKM